MTNWEKKERMLLLSHCTHIDRFHGSHAARMAHIEIQTPYRFTANFIQYMRSIASFRTIIFLRIDIERKNWKKPNTNQNGRAYEILCARHRWQRLHFHVLKFIYAIFCLGIIFWNEFNVKTFIGNRSPMK